MFQVSFSNFDPFLDAEWRINVFFSGISRCHDFRNYDFVKHASQCRQEVMRALYERFGILNLFNPLRPNGSYKLDMAKYEERMVCKMLCELAKQEGFGNIESIKFEGKDVEKLTPDLIRTLTNSKTPEGIFEGTYVCAPEKEKIDLRE